jgi:hypothetical protein
MVSNVCKIKDGIKDLPEILKECEKFALYNGFDKKQILHLRLLCEEIDGLLPNILGDFNGDFWLEYNDGVCKINVSVEFTKFTVEKKNELIEISKNKKNAATVGIVAKIRSAILDLFLDCGEVSTCEMPDYCYASIENVLGFDFSQAWSLGQYKTIVQQENRKEAWDELEKSIIASIADDVIVGVKGKQASIVIIKKFA